MGLAPGSGSSELLQTSVTPQAVRHRSMPHLPLTFWSTTPASRPRKRCSRSRMMSGERLFAVNVMSGVRLSRSYLPGMLERGWGRLVFVSSESALNIPAEMVHYGVTKLAQLGVARGLAESVPRSGVTVNAVLPGPTLTPAVEAFMKSVIGDEAGSAQEAGQVLVERMRPTSLLGRLATSDEVANLIVYLCSGQASATTGASLRVDGGVVRTVA